MPGLHSGARTQSACSASINTPLPKLTVRITTSTRSSGKPFTCSQAVFSSRSTIAGGHPMLCSRLISASPWSGGAETGIEAVEAGHSEGGVSSGVIGVQRDAEDDHGLAVYLEQP